MISFEEWAQTRSAALARSAFLLTANVHDAEDLLQETLVRVSERWPRLARRGQPDAWARKTMHNVAIDRWRRRRARPAELLGEPGESAYDDPTSAATDRLVLLDALSRLTPRQRAVLSLRFYEDLTEVQSAEVLGCSVNTVKSQTRHALMRLRQLAPGLVQIFEEAQ